MIRSLLATALALFVASGCQSSGADLNRHWNVASVQPRVVRYFLGYDADKDGAYRDFQWRRKQDINLTLRRHMLNNNPDNPNHPAQKRRFASRPYHSILPNPVNYIHLEGVMIGLAAWGGGAFIPIPVDSLIGTFEKGGFKEFGLGIVRPFGVVTSSAAPPLFEGEERTVTRVTRIAE